MSIESNTRVVVEPGPWGVWTEDGIGLPKRAIDLLLSEEVPGVIDRPWLVGVQADWYLVRIFNPADCLAARGVIVPAGTTLFVPLHVSAFRVEEG